MQMWQCSPQEILKKLNTNPDTGLATREARIRIKKAGKNELRPSKKQGNFSLLFSQINTPFVYLLIFAAILSLVLEDKIDASIIFLIIIISTLLSFFQERSAVKAMEKLLQIVQVKATVLRDNSQKDIPLEFVVPGDIVILNAGDLIPGDCLLLESKDLSVDEATLTGESFYADKSCGTLPEDTPLAKRTNCLFMGTHVVSGQGKAVVCATGKSTEFGKISGRLVVQRPETEFETGIRQFGYLLMEVTFFMLIAIFAFNIYASRPLLQSILFALALSVGLTPQLLPAIITINLAHGAKKMAESKVIVKKLSSIENFGSMNILCADKTGTLTTGEIELKGSFDYKGEKSDRTLFLGSMNAKFQTGYNNPIDNAILKLEAPAGSDAWSKIDEIPYDFSRKRISVLVKNHTELNIVTKGAFAQILERCAKVLKEGQEADINEYTEDIKKQFERLSAEGYRVIAVAYKPAQNLSSLQQNEERDLIFSGFLTFSDPLKPDIQETIKSLNNSGIHLKVITGDSKLAAMQIANSLGLNKEDVLTGPEIQKMSDMALVHKVNSKCIFAEVEPNQKERIILALRKKGHVVGYLGDGINDVTALHTADVSISVDSGADAAKEVADIVLMEKDLSVLKKGVEAGRMTFANTLKYIFMATSANFGNMFSMAGASLFLSFLPLLPKQILLTNLLTDMPEMTIATDHVDEEVIKKPLRWNIDFIRKFMLVFGLISSIFDYSTFGILLLLDATPVQFRTAWFIESVLSATLIVLVVRTARPFLKSRPSKTLAGMVLLIICVCPLLTLSPIGPILGFENLPARLYIIIAVIVAAYILSVEIAKSIFFRNNKKNPTGNAETERTEE